MPILSRRGSSSILSPLPRTSRVCVPTAPTPPPTTLQSGDEIASFNAFGYNGSATVGPRAAFRTYASQNWTNSANGTYADIATTLNGTTTPAEVIKFENDGGMDTPGVTGGDKGVGTINVAGLYVNGVAVTTLGSGGGGSLSALTGATGANSIENGANAQTWNFDALTTQTALTISSVGITSGELLNVTAANAAGTGYAGYFSNMATGVAYALYDVSASTGAGYGHYSSITGHGNTGYAGYFTNTDTGADANYGVYATTASTGAGYGIYASITGASNTGYAGYFSNTGTAGYSIGASGPVTISSSSASIDPVTITSSRALEFGGGVETFKLINTYSAVAANEGVAFSLIAATTTSFDIGLTGSIGGAGNKEAYLDNRNNGPLTFSTNGVEDLRVLAGGGVAIGQTTLSNGTLLTVNGTAEVTGNSIIIATSNTPADNATCAAGTIWWDTGFVYVCTASGTVKRATLSTY